MDPALQRGRVILGPHVVCPVSNVACIEAHGATAECETVCPLTTAATPGLQELAGVVVAREPGASGFIILHVHR